MEQPMQGAQQSKTGPQTKPLVSYEVPGKIDQHHVFHPDAVTGDSYGASVDYRELVVNSPALAYPDTLTTPSLLQNSTEVGIPTALRSPAPLNDPVPLEKPAPPQPPVPLQDPVALDASPTSLEKVTFYERRHVLRSRWRNITKNITQAIGTTVVAAAALGAIGTPKEAEAGGVRGLEQAGKAVAAQVINETLLKNTPVSMQQDRNGNPVVVVKSVQEQKLIELADTRKIVSKEVENYANAIGLNILNDGMTFQVQNNSNPNQNVTITKYYNPNHYTISIKLTLAPGGGLLLVNHYIKQGQLHGQTATLRTMKKVENGPDILGVSIVGSQ
jgi:hypothetical protein